MSGTDGGADLASVVADANKWLAWSDEQMPGRRDQEAVRLIRLLARAALADQQGEPALTFAEVSATNLTRCKRWHPGFPNDDWTGSDWSNAMQGEAGEAGNVVKKLRRREFGLRGAKDPDGDELRSKLAEEIADTFLYLDLLAAHYGIDLPAAVVSKFNAVSEREGFPDRLRPDVSDTPKPPPACGPECNEHHTFEPPCAEAIDGVIVDGEDHELVDWRALNRQQWEQAAATHPGDQGSMPQGLDDPLDPADEDTLYRYETMRDRVDEPEPPALGEWVLLADDLVAMAKRLERELAEAHEVSEGYSDDLARVGMFLDAEEAERSIAYTEPFSWPDQRHPDAIPIYVRRSDVRAQKGTDDGE